MSKISHFSVTATPTPFIKANVDTDQLLPKQFLTGITKWDTANICFTTGVI
jgi:3-isopropylmalate dehydratase small subunit